MSLNQRDALITLPSDADLTLGSLYVTSKGMSQADGQTTEAVSYTHLTLPTIYSV